jgi:PAS domain S-box-containing protein
MGKRKARSSTGSAAKPGARHTGAKSANRVAHAPYARARAVMDAVPTPLLLLDEDLRIEAANRAFCRMFETSSRKTGKKLLAELGDGEWKAPELLNVLHGVLAEGTPVERLEIGHTFGRTGWKVLLLSSHRIGGSDPPDRRLLIAIEDITAQRQTEAALADERFRIETCFARLPVLAYNVDFNGKIMNCNDLVLKTLGYESKEDLVGRPLISTVYAPASRKKARQLLGKWKEEGELRNEELQVITRDGRVLDVLLNVSTVYDRDGKPLHSFSTQLDITAHKQADMALRDSEAALRQAQSLAHVGSWMWSLKDDSFRMSEELCRIYGLAKGVHTEDIQTVIDELIHPEDREYVEKARRTVRGGREGQALTYRIIRPDGEMRWVTSTRPGASRVGKDGVPEVLVGAVQDVTERKRAREALRQSEEKFRALAEHAPDVIARLDRHVHFVYVNPAITAFGGPSPERVIGKTPQEAGLPEPLCKVLEEAVPKVCSSVQTETVELSFHVTGGERFYRLTVVPELSVDGSVRSLLAVANDITELKEAEEITRRDKATLERLVRRRTDELMEAYQKLADAKRLSDIGMLAATVAHELRNPLGVIQAAIFNISRKTKEPSLDKHVAKIEKKVSESAQIISNLLRYSGIKPPQYEEARIGDILDESIDSARHRFPGHRASVRKYLKAVKDAVVELDVVQIREVLDNTLNNAYQAVGNGDGHITVAAKLGTDEVLIIRIKDDGVGMDKADLDMVFEPFFTTKTRGTGLGLTICRELVNLHGGAIEIESEKGVGTTVTIRLPVRRPAR